jgi:nucleotide-binding universal stress UspA family protein
MTEPFQTILSPIAFDDDNPDALDYAARLAREGGGKVILLHVVPTETFLNEAGAERMAEEKLRIMARDRLGGDMVADVMTEIGDPAEKILWAEKNLDADIVVMSTHGRKGLSHLLLGSVAEKVIREASCPVLTIRQPA